MTENTNIVLENSELLNSYYDLRALSSLPNNEPFFQFSKKIYWGYDLIETIDGKPSCKEIPLSKNSLEGVFYSSDANFNYVGGDIIITSHLPAGTFTESEQHHFSCVGIKETGGKFVAIAVTQPVWIYSHRGVSIELIIKTARSDSLKSRIGDANV